MTRHGLTLEQAAFEAFGEAWKRLRTVEEAVKAGEGASFTHHEAIREMRAAAASVRAAVLTPLAADPTTAQLQAQAFATLRETVTWYADKSNYTDGSPGEWSPQPLHTFDHPSDFEDDEGQRARAALASVQALGPLFDDTPERSGSDTSEVSGGTGLTLEIPLDLAHVIVGIGDAKPQFTEALTAKQHGHLMTENVLLTAQRFELPDQREMHWVAVPGDLALAFTGTSPNSPHVARALAGAWNLLRFHAQAALVQAAAATGDTPVAPEAETGGEEQ
ncbi:hypothetical protein [Deinococcus sp. Leaf326]|uniref:hypothetical protein n=1 Tax=Deinococcus sp. Leaf326 TaxID=1736338 RepID=UPI0006FCBB4E|nr:hypothetical protein [Deinococcus sp. Leaf326]KQR40778.1 hypothetical protein ASF71_01005 [Deinococcus sp. Leaf326]